jgi:nucleotide-binding universal stress UspA family protein
LLTFAGIRQVDLIVMGAYGHSRLRELLLGGVTRTMLDRMTVPVLMAH